MNLEELQKVAFQQSLATSDESGRCILGAFALLGVPKTFLDVGCGVGHMVVIAAALGAEAVGLDNNVESVECAIHGEGFYKLEKADLNLEQVFVDVEFDMVVCLEVAEHLPSESSDNLSDTLSSGMKIGGTLLFSAAVPGQGGSGHLNEQHHEYWQRKLCARGLYYKVKETDALRELWRRVAPNAWWYGQNAMVFGKRTDVTKEDA